MKTLEEIATQIGGYLIDDGLSIRIDTGDNTSKENFDDLLSILDDVRNIPSSYEIVDYYADHDTQIIDFKEIS